MQKYKYSKRAGALQEAALPEPPRPPEQNQVQNAAPPSDSYAAAHDTGRFEIPGLTRAPSRMATALPPPSPTLTFKSLDPSKHPAESGVFFYTIPDAQHVMMIRSDGSMEELVGPRKVFRWFRRFDPMPHHVAHPGEFLIVRFRDGDQKHIPGPSHLWMDPRIHLDVTKEESIQIAEKEAIVVYAKEDDDTVSRRIVYGPASFVPEPGEWLHTFSWHGSQGGSQGYRKIPNALIFQKLWLLPDQMYHDVEEVRTDDGVVLTIKLMIFFELRDVETMLQTTHDPIGDFVNAATSDVVDFLGRHTFDAFKNNTDQLNALATYKNLTNRAETCGYRINKVVYRGYGAPPSLQKMHEQALESRTRLQLERATQEQAQELEDFKLERRLARATKEREGAAAEQAQEIEMGRRLRQAELEADEARRAFQREQERLDQEQQSALRTARAEQRLKNLSQLKKLGVELTQLLTQGRADRVIELRGDGASPHVHLDDLGFGGES